jgi:hypothetical protein
MIDARNQCIDHFMISCFNVTSRPKEMGTYDTSWDLAVWTGNVGLE